MSGLTTTQTSNPPYIKPDISGNTLVVSNLSSFFGDIYMNNNRIKNISDPINNKDVVNKQYVDSKIDNIHWKNPVTAATITNIILSGEQTIDTVSVITGDRVLVKNQTLGIENGVYIVSTTTWSRSDDFDTGTDVSGYAVLVDEGSVNVNVAFLCTNDNGQGIVGTDILNFSQFTEIIQPGEGLSKVLNVLNVNYDSNTIDINGSNQLQVPDGGITNNKLQNDSITITAGTGLLDGGTVSLGSNVTISLNTLYAVPTGMISMIYTSTIPSGWLECNGQSTAGYPTLQTLIGSNVPDLRGQFIRGWDNGAGIDPGRAIGSTQTDSTTLPTTNFTVTVDSNGNHTHTVGTTSLTGSMTRISETWDLAGTASGIFTKTGGFSAAGTPSSIDSSPAGAASIDATHTHTLTTNGDHIHTATVTGGGDLETRPVNVALMYIIKT